MMLLEFGFLLISHFKQFRIDRTDNVELIGKTGSKKFTIEI